MSVDSIQSIRDLLSPNSYMGKGLSWPPCEDPATGDFQRAEAEESISVCLLHLLHTTLGEISPMVTFGTRVDELFFSPGDRGLIQEVIDSIRTAIATHEKRVTVISVLAKVRNVTTSSLAVEISIRYRIVETGKVEQEIFVLPNLGVSA